MFLILFLQFNKLVNFLDNDEKNLIGLVIEFIEFNRYGYKSFAHYNFPLPFNNYKKNPVSQRMFYLKKKPFISF